MPPISRVGDEIEGGLHCHGHDHGPQPSPGRVLTGASKVFVCGKQAGRATDRGFSPRCCGGVGAIVIGSSQSKVFIEGEPAAGVGTSTVHCGIAPGQIVSGCSKVRIP